jgi:Putative DNA-binding domain
MRLAELQALWHSAVAGADPASVRRLEPYCAGSRERAARERIGLYASMYEARLAEAFGADFPKVAALLGADTFMRLTTAYVRTHPSEHYDIGRFGRCLAMLLRGCPELAPREDAADLAELEWARAEVFVERNAVPLDRAGWVEVLHGDPSRTRVSIVPALRLLRLEHDVVPVFRALERGLVAPNAIAEPTALVVWRTSSGHEIFHARMSEQEAVALERAICGATLAEVCDAFAACDSPTDAAFAALSSWLDEGYLIRSRAETSTLDGIEIPPPDELEST